MTYEHFKENYNKLTKAELNSKENRHNRDRFLEEEQEELLQRTKDEMGKRLQECKST